jgi:radical SAM protein with 4Fe4S-binding SPASM domain
MKDRIIEKIEDAYFVLFPSNGYFTMFENQKEAESVSNKGDNLRAVDIHQIPSMYTIHITNRCNLQCKYCFADSTSFNNIDMKSETMELVIKRLASLTIKQLCIDFHGGEPLLRFDLIKYALSLCDKFLSDKMMSYTIQTNATLINDEICRVLKDRNFVVGISLDGPQSIHDRNRVNVLEHGSFNNVMEKIKLLKKYKIPFSIISVITNPQDMYEIYAFFLENQIKKVKIIPVMPQGRAKKEMIDLKEYASCEAELLQLDLDSKTPILLISSYFMLRKMLYVDNSYMCMRSPCGAGINIMSFNEYGTILPCDSMSGIDAMDKISLGNIQDKMLNIHQLDTWKKITGHKIHAIIPCNICQYRNICCGGCKSDTLNFYGDLNHPSPLCAYYKSILHHYYNILAKYPGKTIRYMKLFNL